MPEFKVTLERTVTQTLVLFVSGPSLEVVRVQALADTANTGESDWTTQYMDQEPRVVKTEIQ